MYDFRNCYGNRSPSRVRQLYTVKALMVAEECDTPAGIVNRIEKHIVVTFNMPSPVN